MMKRNMSSWRSLLAAAAVLVSGLAWAAPAVENVAGSLQGGQEVVRIEFSEPLTALPTGLGLRRLPSGPAMPLSATAMSTPASAQIPIAIASTASGLTAPCVRRTSGSTPVRSCFDRPP